LSSFNYTLNGFIRHFFNHSSNGVYGYYLYGFTESSIEEYLSKKWRIFLNQHINESDCFRKKWAVDKKFNFTWKD